METVIRRQTLADLLHRSARRFPAKTAIVCGNTSWTYAQFDAICDRVAAGLAQRGVAKGSRVAVLARNSHAFAAMRFALARPGAVLVPVNFMLKADVAPGVVGEIVHRSPHLMLGYFHDDERTKAAFEGGWFHSGDLGTIDDEGYITVVDRKKDMIKTGGENVASREVEEMIYRMPGVSEVAVIKNGQSLVQDEVLAHCASRLAGFKSPKAVVFTDAIPKNPSGKLLKRELRQRHVDLFNRK